MNTRIITALCAYCEAEFSAKRSTAIYCSASCRQMAYVKRGNEAYFQRMEEEKLLRQAHSVNKNHPIRSIASINNTHSVKLASTKEAYSGLYHQVNINGPENLLSKQNNIPVKSSEEPKCFDTATKEIDIKAMFEQANIDRANRELKRWIEDLLRFDAKGEIFKSGISILSDQIELFCLHDIKTLPQTYSHRHFILNMLRPKMNQLNNHLKQNHDTYFDFEIDRDFKRKLIETLDFFNNNVALAT